MSTKTVTRIIFENEMLNKPENQFSDNDLKNKSIEVEANSKLFKSFEADSTRTHIFRSD